MGARGHPEERVKIEKGTTVRGSFQVEGDLLVEGGLEGKVFVSGRLEIAASGALTGEATCAGGAIHGRVSGIVHSAEPVSVAEQAVVSGRIMAPALDFAGRSDRIAPPASEDAGPGRPATRRPPTVTGDRSQVVVRPESVLRERS
jgi:cytoskeletal protein CcmA (bactofilin family)